MNKSEKNRRTMAMAVMSDVRAGRMEQGKGLTEEFFRSNM